MVIAKPFMTKAGQYAAVVVSAVVACLAFPPIDRGALAWVALVPFIAAVLGETPRGAMNLGFLWGYAFYALGLQWLTGIFGVPALLLMGICALFPALVAWATARARKRWGVSAAGALFAVAWTGVEFFRGELWILKFSWLSLGYSQHANLTMLQGADVAGIYGLTFLIALVNAAVAVAVVWAVDKNATRGRGMGALLVTTALAVSAVWVYGRVRLHADFGHGQIRMVGVQDKARVQELLKTSQHGLDGSGPAVHAVVWPEYAVSMTAGPRGSVPEAITEFARRNRVYMLYGSRERTGGGAARNFRNTAFLISDQGRLAGRAVKRNPVQFIESSVPGRDYAVLDTDFGRVGVGICYDMDYSDVSRNLADRGAEALVFPTADLQSWGRVQHMQHAGMTALRAVETRRAVFRVASSGVSQVVDAHGRVVASMGFNERGFLQATLRRGEVRTLFVRGGYVFPWLCLLVAVAFCAVCGLKNSDQRPM